MSKAHLASTPVPYTHCLRLTLSIDNGAVKLLKASRVAMRAFGADPAPPTDGASGYWFEMRDREGKLLYHRSLPHSDLDSVEVFDDPKGGAIRRIPRADKTPRKVDLIVPDMPAAAVFALHGSAPGADRRKASVVLHRHAMDELRSAAEQRLGWRTP